MTQQNPSSEARNKMREFRENLPAGRAPFRALAEKILKQTCTGLDTYEDALSLVESALKQVGEEEFEAGKKYGRQQEATQNQMDVLRARKDARQEAWEEAAKVADGHAMQFAKPINREQEIHDAWARRIASKIRALAEEEK
jgi:hypothetical protein